MSEINIGKLQEMLPELSALFQQKADYAEMYRAGLEAAEEETGASKKVINKLVAAIKADKAEDAKAEADELSDLIDAIGC